jgi:putative nucleotidyltransferase with HDIG domain
MLTGRALTLLHEWVQSESLRRHCYAVADSMRHFAQLRGADADLWEAVGLLHDMDYERHPNQEQSPIDGHPFVGVAALREQGWSEEVCRAILSHADYAGVTRETPMERTLYAVDELSGFVMAVARVRPSKSIHEVDVASVKKKMKDKAFARAVNRDDIVRGAAELEMPLEAADSGKCEGRMTNGERQNEVLDSARDVNCRRPLRSQIPRLRSG